MFMCVAFRFYDTAFRVLYSAPYLTLPPLLDWLVDPLFELYIIIWRFQCPPIEHGVCLTEPLFLRYLARILKGSLLFSSFSGGVVTFTVSSFVRWLCFSALHRKMHASLFLVLCYILDYTRENTDMEFVKVKIRLFVPSFF